jgi:nicotinamidase-related amidase
MATEALKTYEDAGFGGTVRRGSRPALVIVDFAYGFTDPIYPTAADMSREVAATRHLADVARERSLPVIFTVISYTPGEVAALPWLRKSAGMAKLLAGSRLVEVDERLARRAQEPLIVKHGASAFHGTNLAAILSGLRVDTVIVAGATTSGCVRATAVDAVQGGFDVLVPRECVADRAAAPHEASLFDIQQKYGDVVSVEDVLGYFAGL